MKEPKREFQGWMILELLDSMERYIRGHPKALQGAALSQVGLLLEFPCLQHSPCVTSSLCPH